MPTAPIRHRAASTRNQLLIRSTVRALYWVAVFTAATLALIALHYAVALGWPAYVIGGTALVALYLHDRRARCARRPL